MTGNTELALVFLTVAVLSGCALVKLWWTNRQLKKRLHLKNQRGEAWTPTIRRIR